MDLLRYIRLVLRLGIERADRREFMVTLVLLVIAPVIAAIFGWQFQATGTQWTWGVLGAIGFDLILARPLVDSTLVLNHSQ
jgi:ACR3 family arsenite efflux pump ArsB